MIAESPLDKKALLEHYRAHRPSKKSYLNLYDSSSEIFYALEDLLQAYLVIHYTSNDDVMIEEINQSIKALEHAYRELKSSNSVSLYARKEIMNIILDPEMSWEKKGKLIDPLLDL